MGVDTRITLPPWACVDDVADSVDVDYSVPSTRSSSPQDGLEWEQWQAAKLTVTPLSSLDIEAVKSFAAYEVQ